MMSTEVICFTIKKNTSDEIVLEYFRSFFFSFIYLLLIAPLHCARAEKTGRISPYEASGRTVGHILSVQLIVHKA
jgi:hypothetical protein